jgi:hypothetical protein
VIGLKTEVVMIFEWFALILSVVMIVGVMRLARTFVRRYQEELPQQHGADLPEPGYRFSADMHAAHTQASDMHAAHIEASDIQVSR